MTSFRERSALFMAIIMALAFVFYVKWTAFDGVGVTSATFMLVIFLVVGSIIVQAVLGALRPSEANEPADERERIIMGRASQNALPTMLLGGGLGMYFFAYRDAPETMYHVVALSILMAYIVDYATQFVLLRRG